MRKFNDARSVSDRKGQLHYEQHERDYTVALENHHEYLIKKSRSSHVSHVSGRLHHRLCIKSKNRCVKKNQGEKKVNDFVLRSDIVSIVSIFKCLVPV